MVVYQANAQQYRVTFSGYTSSEPCAPDPIQTSWSRIYIENNVQSVILLNSNCGIDDFANDEVAIISFKPDRIRVHDYALHNNGSVVINYTEILDLVFDHCHSESDLYIGAASIEDITIEPIIEISSSSPNPTSSCDNITLNASNAGFETDIYNWQYYTAADGWNNLSGFQGLPNIEVGIGDIPGLGLNETVQFRINHCGSVPTQILIRSFGECSPALEGAPVVNPPDCSYDNNGYFTVYFDRALLPGEEIDFNLYKGGMGGGALLFTQNNVGTLGAGNSYTWPNGLESDTYYLQYQSNPTGSLSGFTQIAVTTPAVTFNVLSSTNINCFGENTGSIEIDASGGVGGYQYQLMEGGNWVNFNDPAANHTIINNQHIIIQGLPADTYQIRVRDAIGCTEQN